MPPSRHARHQGALARVWLRVAPLLALGVIAGVAAAVWWMQGSVQHRQHALDQLVQIEAASGQQGSMALGAMVRGRVSLPETLIISSLSAQVQRRLDGAGRANRSWPLLQADRPTARAPRLSHGHWSSWVRVTRTQHAGWYRGSRCRASWRSTSVWASTVRSSWRRSDAPVRA